MNYYSDFVISFGLILILIGTATAWLFKTSTAGLAWKLALPVALIALACHTPLAVNGLLGLPVNTTLDALPSRAQLVAFHVIDDERRVDLWLLSGAVPRAYQAPMDAKMKRVLKAAQAEMQGGRPAYIRRKGQKGDGGGSHGNNVKGKGKQASAGLIEYDRDDQVEYELVPGVELLPEKN